jgi:hypothetical protein
MGLYLPQRWRRQPSLRVGVNLAHPSSDGLVLDGIYPAAGLYDTANTPAALTVPNGIDSGTVDGVRPAYVFSGTKHINCGNPSKLGITGSITVMAIVLPDPACTAGQIIAKDKDTGGRAYNLDKNQNDYRFYIAGGLGADLIAWSGAGSDTKAVLCGRWISTSNEISLWSDGLKKTSGTTTSTSIPSATANVLIGRREYAGFEGNWAGKIGLPRIWNRALSDAEIVNLSADPDALFAPIPARNYFFSAAAGDVLMAQACL